jgi:2-(1,2-epoxy-1,2-dihydrophenyl)acetyl-CoA isomerase
LSTILYAAEHGVATLRFNRPQQLNAMSVELMQDLTHAFDRAASDDAVRVIVLTGEGRGFCSGADLAANIAKPPLDAQGRLDLGMMLEKFYNPLVTKMRSMDKPIIAAVNGIAAGAGCSLALMADLTIAARSAKFLQAFVNIGLILDAGATWILPRSLGPQRAMGFALLGEKVTAEQAHAWGLIWDVVDDDQLMAHVGAIASRLAQGPGVALARIKRSLHASATNDLATQLALEVELQRECGRSTDFMEGATSFLQKRKPAFKNR